MNAQPTRSGTTCALPLMVIGILLTIVRAALGQDASALIFEQGDRRFEFDGDVDCIARTGRSRFASRLLAERFLLVRTGSSTARKYFVNELAEMCPVISDDVVATGFTNLLGDSIGGRVLCRGDWYVQVFSETVSVPDFPRVHCELGQFWPVSTDIGTILAGDSVALVDAEGPAYLSVVAAEERRATPDTITASQAFFGPFFPVSGYETCVAECSDLESLEVPGCLQVGRIRERLISTFVELVEPADDVELPDGSCGCATFTIPKEGGVENPSLIFSNSQEAGDIVLETISGLALKKPLPSDASCLIDMTMPFPFFE